MRCQLFGLAIRLLTLTRQDFVQFFYETAKYSLATDLDLDAETELFRSRDQNRNK
jgi:hypothetical protein